LASTHLCSLSSNKIIYLRECTHLLSLLHFLPDHPVYQLPLACPRGRLSARRRLTLSKCNKCIKVRFPLISQIYLLSISPSQNKMLPRMVFNSNHCRQPLPRIPQLKSLRMRPLLTILFPELQGKQKLPKPRNLAQPLCHRRPKLLRRRKGQRRRKTGTKHPSWCIQTMMSAQRRRWQGCQGTHSLLNRKLPRHKDTVLLQFNLRLIVSIFLSSPRDQMKWSSRPAMVLRIQLSPLEFI
jgi:hypothetical protein